MPQVDVFVSEVTAV